MKWKRQTLQFPPLRRVATYLAVGVGILLAVSVAVDWYFPRVEYLTVQSPPIRITETRLSEKIVEVPVVRTVLVKEPTPRQEKKLERQYGLDFRSVELLKEVKGPPAPDGWKGAVTLDKTTGAVEITVVNEPRAFFALGGPTRIGPSFAYTQDGLAVGFHLEKELARTGRVHWRVDADVASVSTPVTSRVTYGVAVRALWSF